jgi:ribosome-associated protein
MSTATVPIREIHFRTSRSGGPGGQNVNKVETRVEAWWSLENSPAFTPAEKARLRAAMGRRLGADGAVRVVSQKFRSQSRNREAAVERLRALVADALKPRKSRRATRPTTSSREARLEAKKRRATTKRLRISGHHFDG